MAENISLLPCTKWFIHTQHSFFFQWRRHPLLYDKLLSHNDRVWKATRLSVLDRHTLQQRLSLLSTAEKGRETDAIESCKYFLSKSCSQLPQKVEKPLGLRTLFAQKSFRETDSERCTYVSVMTSAHASVRCSF